MDAVALAHRRLKIIDLSAAGDQPMIDDELGLTIVFNGCIYNHHELRRELERDGYRFFSHSDTEVILKAYDRWGRQCVERLFGMFAFALFDHGRGGCRWRATGSGSSRCTWPMVETPCGSRRRFRRCWPEAASTPSSTRSRCITSSAGTAWFRLPTRS